jgi:pimeloyl-ACP methyl ester carboxylesterase
VSDKLTLLFLHGVGDGDRDDLWRVTLEGSLRALGYPSLDAVQVISPKYAHALTGWDEKLPVPGLTIKQPTRDTARENRREFERRTGAIELRLGRHDRGQGVPGVNALMGLAVALPTFEQARNYLRDTQVRARVLSFILGKLPETGRLVIVGHSLGSVIAADLVRRLPVGLRVAGMVTIGSPLASAAFDVDNLRDGLADPPTNLEWWVNFWNPADPVAVRRGLSSVIPWLVDLRIDTSALMIDAHASVDYLSDRTVAEAIGYAVFGSRSQELAKVESGVDIPLDAGELFAVLALRYAHLMKHQLKGDLRQRFAGALRRVQATAVDDIRSRNKREGRPMPSAVAHLAFDFSDPSAPLPEPAPVLNLTRDDALVPLTVLASENVVRPFEIALPRDKWRNAMRDMTAEMGLGSQFGTDVFEVAKIAETALSNGLNWIKIGALGIGAAAIIFATGGLVLAAGAGLAGAAAITSALASFGPGGMIGGLLTAGTLVGAGGGGIALGLASSGTNAATLEAVVERRLGAELLRQRQQLDLDPTVWITLVETEIEVRREHERLDEFSDDGASTIKELKRKIVILERALKFLKDRGLEPGDPAESRIG